MRNESRQQRLERTLHNHQDSQQMALDSLAGNGENIPHNWERLKDYIKHDIHMCRNVFGVDCVGITDMDKISGLLSKYHTVRAYTPILYATVMWRYHVARMEIFSDPDAISLKALWAKPTSLEVLSLPDFQEEVQLEIRKVCGVHPPTANKRLSSAAESVGASGKEHPTKQLRQQQPKPLIKVHVSLE